MVSNKSVLLLLVAALLLIVPPNQAQEEEILRLVSSALQAVNATAETGIEFVHKSGNEFADTVNSLGALVVPPGPVKEFTVIIRFLFSQFVQNAHQSFNHCEVTFPNILKSISARIRQLNGCSNFDINASLIRYVRNVEEDGEVISKRSNRRIGEIVEQNIVTMLQLLQEAYSVDHTPALKEDMLQRYSDAVKQLSSETVSELVDRQSRLRSLVDRGLQFILYDVKRQLEERDH